MKAVNTKLRVVKTKNGCVKVSEYMGKVEVILEHLGERVRVLGAEVIHVGGTKKI